MLNIDLQGRVALVTGGTRGIGRATVEHLSRAGARLVINYIKEQEAASQLVDSIKRRGGEAFAVRADVSSMSDAAALIDSTINAFNRLDILVCNAGIWIGSPLEEMSEELWDSVLDTNLKGTWTVCRAAVPVMKRSGGGKIVIISSTAGQRGEAGYSNYAASKGGQISFTKSLAAELAPYGFNVNAVAPGWVDTDLSAEVFKDIGFRQSIESMIPLKRIASPDDVALPTVFLCSEWAKHITGEVLNVNGGSLLCG